MRPGRPAGWLLPGLSCCVLLGVIAAYAALLPRARWQGDEYLVFAMLRAGGWDYLLHWYLTWSPRLVSDVLFGLYGAIVLALHRPLAGPCMAVLWAGLACACVIPAWLADANRLPRVVAGLGTVRTFPGRARRDRGVLLAGRRLVLCPDACRHGLAVLASDGWARRARPAPRGGGSRTFHRRRVERSRPVHRPGGRRLRSVRAARALAPSLLGCCLVLSWRLSIWGSCCTGAWGRSRAAATIRPCCIMPALRCCARYRRLPVTWRVRSCRGEPRCRCRCRLPRACSSLLARAGVSARCARLAGCCRRSAGRCWLPRSPRWQAAISSSAVRAARGTTPCARVSSRWPPRLSAPPGHGIVRTPARPHGPARCFCCLCRRCLPCAPIMRAWTGRFPRARRAGLRVDHRARR